MKRPIVDDEYMAAVFETQAMATPHEAWRKKLLAWAAARRGETAPVAPASPQLELEFA